MTEDGEKVMQALGICFEMYHKGFNDGKKAQANLDTKMYELINETFENMCVLMNKYNETLKGE